jgi:hypothetical protein
LTEKFRKSILSGTECTRFSYSSAATVAVALPAEHRSSLHRRLGIPLPLLSAFSGKWMPLSVEILCALPIYGLASILHRKNYY